MKRNSLKRIITCLQATVLLAGITCGMTAHADSVSTNDPYAYAQYYLRDTGVVNVWNNPFRTPSSQKIKIAIYEGTPSGFDLNQEDMLGQWSNAANSLYNVNPESNGNTHHGTQVASVIAMNNNNNIGGIGICPNVELYPFYSGESRWNSLSKVIDECIDRGIYLINCSFGGRRASDYYNPDIEAALQRYQNFGGVVVCGAGNDDSNNDVNLYFPALYSVLFDNVLSVTGSRNGVFPLDYDSGNPSFHYGQNSVNLAAPAVDMLVPRNRFDHRYFASGGTSLSAPFVTGVMALLKSYFPSASMMDIKDAILNTVDVNSSFENRCATSGTINAERAFYMLEEQLYPDDLHIAEGVYYIKNCELGQYLTATNTNQYGEVKISNLSGNSNQKWRMKFEDNHYVISPLNNNSVSLDIWNAYIQNATKVWLYNYTGANCQKWKLAKGEYGYQLLSKANNNYALDYTGGPKAAIYQRSSSKTKQNWVFEKAADLNGTYYIKNNYSNSYIISPGSGSGQFTILNSYCDSSASKWNIVPLNDGYYKIVAADNPSKCLEIFYANTNNYTAVWQLNYSGQNCQKWKITQNADGSYRIASRLNDDLLLSFNRNPNNDPVYQNTLCISNTESGNSTSAWTLENVNTVCDGKLLRQVKVGGSRIDFTVKYFGNGTYRLVYGNKYLEINSTSQNTVTTDIDRTVLLAWPSFTSENQVWRIRKINGQFYVIPQAYQCTSLNTQSGKNEWLTSQCTAASIN